MPLVLTPLSYLQKFDNCIRPYPNSNKGRGTPGDSNARRVLIRKRCSELAS